MWIALACLAVLAQQPSPAATPQARADSNALELLANPSFAAESKGWALRHAEYSDEPGHDGSGAAVILAERGADTTSHVGAVVDDPPTGRLLHFTCWLRTDVSTPNVQVNAFSYAHEHELVDQWSEPVRLKRDQWTKIDTSYVLDSDAKRLELWIVSNSGHDLLASDAHLLVGEAEEARLGALRGAGVIRASAVTSVLTNPGTDGGWITFPIPNTYRGQIPLTFELTVDPPAALKEFHWTERDDGINVLCEIHVVPPAGSAEVRWESLVYVPSDEPRELPLAKEPEVPAEARKWLASTACVQSADPDIAAKAKELGKDTSDVQAFVEKVIAFTSKNRGKPGVRFDTLDARKALDCGGSCTSRANLAAALLRAHGIPARTVAHLPTWADKLYEHWLVEYWHPGVGWTWIEPSMGEMQPRTWTVAVLNVASPADEERGFDESIRHSDVMLGVPDLSVHKHSPELEKGWDEAGLIAAGGNWAHAAMRIRVGAYRVKAFEAKARAAYAVLLADGLAGRSDPDRTAGVEAALATKKLDELERALAR